MNDFHLIFGVDLCYHAVKVFRKLKISKREKLLYPFDRHKVGHPL